MKELQKIEIPVSEAEDYNREHTTWRNDKCIALDEGKYITYYIDHETIEQEVRTHEDERIVKTVCLASPVRVAKPVNRDMAINAAEMAVYGLKDAMEVASFNASLARKSRIDPNDSEVVEHDEFIGWVKDKLTEIGI